MATLAELKARIMRLVGAVEESDIEDGVLIDSICAAFDAILPWQPKRASTSFAGDGTTISFSVPDDFYEVEACVVNSSGEILRSAFFAPENYYGESIAGTNDWLETPSGSISFSKPIPSGETYGFYYLAQWAKPTESMDETTTMEPPGFLTTAISVYAGGYILLTQASSVADIKQFATKTDLGTPESNPMIKTANWLFQIFNNMMNGFPKHQKAQR